MHGENHLQPHIQIYSIEKQPLHGYGECDVHWIQTIMIHIHSYVNIFQPIQAIVQNQNQREQLPVVRNGHRNR